jgi:hypothetical protein
LFTALAAAIGVASSLILAPTAAFAADQQTTIAFAQSSQSVGYGSDWVVSLSVGAVIKTGPTTSVTSDLDENDGTVDVFVDGGATAFASSLHIYPGGEVFLTQPSAVATLAAGSHTLTAVFRPAAGSRLATSQTAAPLTLTVTPLDLTASATLVKRGRNPVVRASLTGAYVKGLGAPAGTWKITLTGGGTKTPLTQQVVQTAGGPASLDIPLGPVQPGTAVSIQVTFAPAAGDAGGPVTQPGRLHYAVPALTPAEIASMPIPAPWWGIGLAAFIVFAAAAILTIQILRLVRRRRATPPEAGGGETSRKQVDEAVS